MNSQPTNLSAAGHRHERRILIGLTAVVATLYVCSMTVADPDLWGHTLYGLRAIEQGVLTERQDPFSYTAAGATWTNHEWLTEYQYGWLWRNTGETGLWLWRNLMVVIVFGVGVFMFGRARAGVAAAVLLLLFAAECLAGFCMFIRPQLATFALFAITLAVLRCWWDRPTSRWVWLLPLVCGVWVNLHGGYLAGLGLLGLFVVSAWVRAVFQPGSSERNAAWTISAVGLLAGAATLLNPYGFGLYRMLWHHLVPEQAVREWQPLWGAWQAPMYYVPFVVVVLTMVGSRKWRWLDALILLVVGYQAVSHIRHVALLAIATLVLLPGPLSDSLNHLFRRVARQFASPGRAWLRYSAVGLALIALVGLELPVATGMWRSGIWPWQIAVESRRNAPGVPARAVRVICREGLQGNLITEYSWGQYVIWHLFPSSRVAFDGRYRTVYPPQLEAHYLSFLALGPDDPPRTPLLDDYQSEMALLANRTSACQYLAQRSDWAEIYRDDQATLYVRRLPRFAQVIKRSARQPLAEPNVARWNRFPGGPVTRQAGALPADSVVAGDVSGG